MTAAGRISTGGSPGNTGVPVSMTWLRNTTRLKPNGTDRVTTPGWTGGSPTSGLVWSASVSFFGGRGPALAGAALTAHGTQPGRRARRRAGNGAGGLSPGRAGAPGGGPGTVREA